MFTLRGQVPDQSGFHDERVQERLAGVLHPGITAAEVFACLLNE